MSSVPTATISRLVIYYRILCALENQGVKKTSSEHLAEGAQVSAFQVRKDFAYFGRFGTRGAGYSVPTLRRELRRILGLTRPWNAVVVGAGFWGQAVLSHKPVADFDFAIKGAFDQDASKVGQVFSGYTVQPLTELAKVVREKGVDMGIIAVPEASAQEVADALVQAGVQGILNFAPTLIEVPREVHVEAVDFLSGLTRLSFYTLNPQLREEL